MRKKREELTMRATYEPNRFSATYLMDAYEVIAPTIKQPLSKKTSTTKKIVVEPATGSEGDES